jgi:hypothetical protein
MLMLTIILFSMFIYGNFVWKDAYAASSTTISVSPSTITASVGQNFTVNVTVSNVYDLYGWQFRLNWTAGLIEVVKVTEGPFLRLGGSTYFYWDVNATAGRMVADCTLLGNVPGVSGSGTLATITFNVKGVGQSPLTLWDVVLLNSFEQSILCQVVSGYGYFKAAHDVAVTAVNVSPLTVVPGDIVYINVTVQNKGAYTEIFNVTVYANSAVVGVQTISLDATVSAMLHFSWNTSGMGKGDYTISASASAVPGEVNTADNSFVAAEPVTILTPGHDVAVVGVFPSKTVVCEGYPMNITVKAKNYGTYNEVFNVTVYANKTAIWTREISLTSGASAFLTFTWNTVGFVKGNYTMLAYAWPVQGEIDITDNKLADGWVIVAMTGDINADGIVDIFDCVKIALAFSATPHDPNWDPNADIDNSYLTDIFDLVIVAIHFGETDP